MKRSFGFLVLLATCVLVSCRQNESAAGIIFSMPEAGTHIKSGEDLSIDLEFGSGRKTDSVIYLLDSTVISRAKDTSAVKVNTANLPLGNHLITAKIFKGGSLEEISSNIIISSSKVPLKYTFQVINTFPHDTSSYTQGLEYHNGVFYESDGEYGGSSLRKVQPQTGKIIKKIDIDSKIFAEGITLVGDKIIQLTWEQGIGIVYRKSDFKKLSEFAYQESRQGWGLCFDGKRIFKSDGTNRLYFLNKDTYREEGYIEVLDDQGEVYELNELEYIEGKIYANVYQTDKIVIINPKTGEVEAEINMKGILPQADYFDSTNVLNGIAWDPAGKRLFVTGKKWDKLFEIKVIKE